MEILQESTSNSSTVQITVLQPYSSRVEFTTTCSCSNYKDILYQVYQGRLLASFQEDAKYEHVGQDTRSQDGKDDKDKQGKDLKISEQKTKSKDNDKGSRSKIT
ncbi:hypothetical protein Tco_0850093 [Tanacetum coccineum]